jgi:hypothetical protein
MKDAAIRTAVSFTTIGKAFGGFWRAMAYFEEHKDEPQDVLAGRTPREVYIDYGNYARDTFGDDYFAKLWAKEANTFRGYGRLLVPDIRFQTELDAAVGLFGAPNVLLVRVHRPEYDWTNDIGTYLKHSVSIDFNNTGGWEHDALELELKELQF